MSEDNNPDDLFSSLKSIDQNNNIESIDKIGFETQLQSQFNRFEKEDNSKEQLDKSDTFSISKSSSFIKNEKQNPIKDISNIQISFSNISELDRKVLLNETGEKEKDPPDQLDPQEDLSISTNSIKVCNNVIKKTRDGNSYTPSTLCNYYQHSNEVTPIQNEGKYSTFNPVNIHQVNLNLIYNNMNNTEDSSLIKSASKKASTSIKYTKAQCNNNNSNEGQIQMNSQCQALPDAKVNNYLISTNDNIEFITKKKPLPIQEDMNKLKAVISDSQQKQREVLLIKQLVIQISLETTTATSRKAFAIDTLDSVSVVKETSQPSKEIAGVYFNGLRFGKEGETNPFSMSNFSAMTAKNKPAVSIKSNSNNNCMITPKDADKNNAYHVKNVKTESTANNSKTPKASNFNSLINPHIPSFSTSKKVKEIIAGLIQKSKSKSKSKSNSHSKKKLLPNKNMTRNLTLTSRNVKQEYSLKKQSSTQSSNQQQPKQKSLSNGRNRNIPTENLYKKIITGIKIKEKPVNKGNDRIHNIKPISTLFNSGLNANAHPKKEATFSKAIQIKPQQKLNSQINLASILSKFDRQPKKRIESSRQSTLSTLLNETILNNNNNQINDTFSKIVLHTQETSIATETNTNPNIDHPNVHPSKYVANSSIASIKKIPKVIQNFSCYKKKNSFQSHFVSKDEIASGPSSKAQPFNKCIQLRKVDGDEAFNIIDE